MQDFSAMSRMPYLQTPCMYDHCHQMLTMPEEQLERMYPQIYYIVNPVVVRQCDRMDDTYGMDYTPTREELERITDEIILNIDAMVRIEMPEGSRSDPCGNPDGNPNRNPNGNPDGNPDGFLRGLVGVLLIRELLDRRRSRRFGRRRGFYSDYYPGYFDYYPGYYPGLPGFY